ncbi:MAG TPA: ComF family protein [Pyrinomonadaceae bacterium]|nr:ComF family protein [Pyrinomonadaceae bacterium]
MSLILLAVGEEGKDTENRVQPLIRGELELISQSASLIFDSCLALLYPQSCEVCGGSVVQRQFGVACKRCWRDTQIFDGTEVCCWKCGELTRGTVPFEQRESVRCHRCEDHAFTVARAAGVYRGALRASVIRLKREPRVSSLLLNLLVNTQRRTPLNEATRIVPVPLHAQRQKTRGFNQASVIANALGQKVALPVDETSLVRVAHTERHRAGMDARDRRESVENAFVVEHPRLIAGERILLVDDVFTTGATVSECADVLLAAGAEKVFVLTIARPLPFDYSI